MGVAPALAGPSVAIESETELSDEDGLITHSIIFNALPPAEVLIEPPDARVAYASLIVFEDLNGNGVLDIGQAFSPISWGGRQYQDEIVMMVMMTDRMMGLDLVMMKMTKPIAYIVQASTLC